MMYSTIHTAHEVLELLRGMHVSEPDKLAAVRIVEVVLENSQQGRHTVNYDVTKSPLATPAPTDVPSP
jgi:hypothetical protein